MTIDIKEFYLMTPMERFECMRLKIANISKKIIKKYELRSKVSKEGYVYVEVQTGMCRTPQEVILSQRLIKQRLNVAGY